MIIKDITNILEKFAPLSFQESYDNSGLIIGDASNSVSGVLLTVDVTSQHITEAIDRGCNLIVSHHPMVFSGIKRFVGETISQRLVVEAIKKDISIYACHTNIDNAQGGVSFVLGEKLGLKNMKVMIPNGYNAANDIMGSGVIGDIKECDAVEFLLSVKDKLSLPMIRHSQIVNNKICKVALCGGSGASFSGNAKLHGADIYLSGDFKYHDFFDAAGYITVADIGHYESEKFIIDTFYELISKIFPTFVVCKTKLSSNPITYL